MTDMKKLAEDIRRLRGIEQSILPNFLNVDQENNMIRVMYNAMNSLVSLVQEMGGALQESHNYEIARRDIRQALASAAPVMELGEGK